MDRRAPGAAAPMRTFAALAALMAAGLTLPAGPPRTGPANQHLASPPGHVVPYAGRYAAVFTAPPGALVTVRTSAADAAGGTVTETITSAYRAGR